MKISVIIPTINFSSGIKRALADIKRQTADIAEILIVDSSSDDGTADIARGMGLKVITVPREAFDHGGTRALAARAAAGDILVYFTQDAVLPDRNAVARLVAVFEDVKIGAAYGRQLPHTDADIFGRVLRFFNYPDTSCQRSLGDRKKYGIKTPFLSNSFSAYSKKVLEEIGWFKDGLILGEDTYAGARMLMAGYRIAYVSEAVALHSHNYTIRQEFKRYFDIGVFHRKERWILDTFGEAEGEGLTFILSSLKFMKENRASMRVPEFFWRTGLKYLGYKAGYFHDFIPLTLVKRLSMHSSWWSR